jgi:hypothetical protein
LIAACAAFAAFNSSLMLTMVRHFSTHKAERVKSHTSTILAQNLRGVTPLPWPSEFWPHPPRHPGPS